MIRPSSNPQDSPASPAREPMDHTPLPSIDLNQEDAAIIGALERAFTSTGFVLVHGHGIGPDQVAAMRLLIGHRNCAGGKYSRGAHGCMVQHALLDAVNTLMMHMQQMQPHR